MIEKLTDYNMSVCYEDKQYFLFVILGLSLANMWPYSQTRALLVKVVVELPLAS